MSRVILASILMLAVLLVGAIWGPDWADYSLGVFLLFVWLITSKEFPDFVDRVSGWLTRHASGSRVAASLKRILPAFAYGDLSLILASVLLLGVGVSISFVEVVQDLEAKGFLFFDPKRAGFVHLQILIVGYFTTLPLLLTCAAHGFWRGLREGRASFAKQLMAVFLGFLIAVLLMSLVYGGFVGGESRKTVEQATSGSLPAEATLTAPMILISATLTLWLGLAALTWTFSQIGRWVKNLLGRLKRGSSSARQEVPL